MGSINQVIAMGMLGATVAGCGAASSDNPAHGRPESPESAARRTVADPTREGREQLIREWTAANPIPEEVRQRHSRASTDTPSGDPSLGQVSQPLKASCIEHIDGCVDWSGTGGWEWCVHYQYCTVNVCEPSYRCTMDY